MDSGKLIQRLEGTLEVLKSFPSAPDALRELQTMANAIAAEQARLVVEMSETLAYEAEGCSSPKTWLRDQLHLDTREAHRLLAAAPALRDLPEVAMAARAGAIGADHVKHFAYGLKHFDAQVIANAESWLLDVATTAEPAALKTVIKSLREAVYPDELDQAWIDGMDREDIRLSPVPDGWHLTGFLNTQTGAKFQTVLESLSAPTEAEDHRTSAERRISGLDALLTSVLESGLPQDRGVRPHIRLSVDLEQLAVDPHSATAELAGFGSIGPRQLQQMLCDAELTPILTAGRHSTLDVGRSLRLATGKQRHAIEEQQDGRCAGPGCRAPIVHIHHIEYWSQGGATDLDNLIGLCPRCHSLVHAKKLVIDPASKTFTHDGFPRLPRQHRRRRRHRYRERHEVIHARNRALAH